MSDTAIAEAPAEPVPPIAPAPEATVEIEAAAVDGLAPATDQGVAAPTELPAAVEAASTSAAPAADRAMPEIEYPVGPVRQAVLDHFLDSDSPEQSMAQIKAGLSTVLPGTVEAAVRREWEQGRLLRVSPGVYRLAPPKPAEPAKPAPQPDPPAVRSDGMTDQDWLAALEAWVVDHASWDVEKLGPRPNEPGNRIPPDIRMRFTDRLRKRQERQRDREVADAKRAAADRELRDKLITATAGNIIRGPAIDDVSPIRAALDLVPIERILSAIRAKTDKKLFPGNEPATSWREQRLLKEIAESYFRSIIQPRLVAAWSAAGKTPAPKTQSLPLAVADMPVGDIDRSHHDNPSAPPGPHDLRKRGDTARDVPANAADAAEATTAVSAPLEPENASTVPPAQSNGHGSAEPVPDPPDDKAPEVAAAPAAPAAVSREQILAAFNRSRVPPSPQPAPPQPAPPQPRPAERPWFAGPEAQEREAEFSEEAWEKLISGFVAGNVVWNTRRLGPEPGNHGCRAPQSVLRRYRL
jgi:hypothetical protein